jgi:ketosteroid isomerase-like protein
VAEVTETTLGERFARAIADRDTPELRSLLAPEVDFCGLTPGRFWEAASASELVDEIVFGKWFEETDHIDALEHVDTDTVVDRHRVGYRFRVTNPGGTFAVEQQAYYEVRDGQITWLRLLCSGYRRLGGPPG